MASAPAGSAPADPLAAAAFAALDRLAPSGGLGLAVSGGSDSLALLHLAADWARARGRAVRAATVEHGLRGAAPAEAAAVARLAARLGVAHEMLAVVLPPRGNLQARAREARLGALGAWARGHGLGAVALGHTRDDQAETVLMRLARGSGVDGLAGMAAARALDADEPAGPRLVRPLLALDREALRGWLRARGLGWVEDPSNADPAFDRVRARAALRALGPLGIDAVGLAATAARLGEQRAVLDEAAMVVLRGAVTPGRAGEIRIEAASFAALPADIARRAVAVALFAATGEAVPPRRRTLDRVTTLLGRAEDEGFEAQPVGRGLLALGRDGRVSLCREPSACPPPLRARHGVVWDARALLALVPRGGVTLGALGIAGQRAIADTREPLSTNHPPASMPSGWYRRMGGWWRAPWPARRTTPTVFDATGEPIALVLPDGLLKLAPRPRGGPPRRRDFFVPTGARHLVAERLRHALRGA
ncbi:MAG: tRNA lysidine(34) synthetase TilS [Paracoccaceae bacterium]